MCCRCLPATETNRKAKGSSTPTHGRAAAQIRNSELIDYRPAEGEPVAQIPADELWSVPFEKSAPIRKSSTYKGQKNFTGE